jgi:hypothetical protein
MEGGAIGSIVKGFGSAVGWLALNRHYTNNQFWVLSWLWLSAAPYGGGGSFQPEPASLLVVFCPCLPFIKA